MDEFKSKVQLLINAPVMLFCRTCSTLIVGLILCLFSESCAYAVSSQSPGSNVLGLTAKEIEWLKQHPVVRLAPDPDFPPIEYLDKDGTYRGIAADFIRLLETKLPLKFEVVALESWSEVLRQIKAKTIDMCGAAVPTSDRLRYMRFTRAYVSFPAVVLVRNSAQSFPTLSQLKGKRVAVVSNYADHEYMVKSYPQIPLEVMPDISAGLRQVSFGKVDAMVLNLASASYFIQKDGISNLRVTEDTDFVFDLSFANRIDWPELTTILEKAMKAISPSEKQAILDKWISLGQKSWRPSSLFMTSAAAIILFLLTFAILTWNRILQNQVRDRTADLEAELSERLQIEQEKSKLQEQVFRAKKMEAVGLLAGGVAHDLNNILAGTVGYADLALRKVPEDTQLRRYLEEIKDSGRRAGIVVADLLTLSRDSASDRKVAHLNTLVEEYFHSPEHLSLVNRFADIDFKFELSSDLHTISCSVVHIKKSIMNLVINAAEATQSGEVVVRTTNKSVSESSTCTGVSLPGDYALLSVVDNGPGINPEDREHIFEPFYSRKKLGQSGTGLGLAVVWNTVTEHNGFIEVKLQDRGSRFDLYLPVSDHQATPSDREVPEDELLGSGEHILVVDDEERVRKLACRLLTELQYKVSQVASGEEALDFLQNEGVDLLVLDMIMEPGMSGYETFERIKQLLPGQKAVIASGFSESGDVKRAQQLGAGIYIKKPYTIEEIGLAVKQEINRQPEVPVHSTSDAQSNAT